MQRAASDVMQSILLSAVIDALEALFDISLEHVLWGVLDAEKDGSDSIMGGASWPEPVGVGFKLGFPFRFQRQRDQGLPGSIPHGGNAKWTLFQLAGLRDVPILNDDHHVDIG